MLPRYNSATAPTVSSATASAHRRRLARRLVVAVVLRGGDLDDDGRDVVEASTPVRLGDERVDDASRRGPGEQQLLQAAIVDHPREAVAGDEVDVARLHFAVVGVGFH